MEVHIGEWEEKTTGKCQHMSIWFTFRILSFALIYRCRIHVYECEYHKEWLGSSNIPVPAGFFFLWMNHQGYPHKARIKLSPHHHISPDHCRNTKKFTWRQIFPHESFLGGWEVNPWYGGMKHSALQRIYISGTLGILCCKMAGYTYSEIHTLRKSLIKNCNTEEELRSQCNAHR